MSDEPKPKRGFAAMSPERRSEMGKMGAAAVAANGTRHRWTPEEARKAAKKGGQALRRRGSEYMSQIGKLGGQARAAKRSEDE